MGLSKRQRINLHKGFNETQIKWYRGLSDTSEYTLLYGPYGSGKTHVYVTVAAEILINAHGRNKVLYTVETNQAINEVALCFI
jgi:DNA replication protein DnaC